MAQLALVVHFHQPVGNLDRVVQSATDRCYRPFLETLARYPDVPMTLHYSGCLLEWLEANAADVVATIGELVDRGQIELMTGGFYEPILAALPARDQLGQIRMMSDHLAARYAADATGLWLTERVWEQDVLPAIVDAGVRYTVLDDTIFHSVGITDDELNGAFVTEHSGKPLLVYAGDRRLRYLIPYKRVERALDYLTGAGDDRFFVYADDGEKFGEWPDTFDRVYTNGWLRKFFNALHETDDVTLTTLGAHAADPRPLGRVYLPSSSYDEMMTWALPAAARLAVGRARRQLSKDDPDGLLPFLRGAPWRAFLAKYPEVNQLQKRMLHVSDAVHAAGAPQEPLRELYRAQCNCAYWHGAFGGVYLSFMRSALWHHLMRAEGDVKPKPGIELVDLDADARAEVLIHAPWGAAVASTVDARLVELDDWGFGANLLAVAARHREAYHLADENPPEDEDDDDDDEMAAIHATADVDRDSLTFDDAPLGGCVDLIDGRRIDERWSVETDGSTVSFSTATDGLGILKLFVATADGLECRRAVTNNGASSRRLVLASETACLPLNRGRDAQPTEVRTAEGAWRALQPDAEVCLEVALDPPGHVTWSTIETASATLEGLMPMHQGAVVATEWTIELAPGETYEVSEVLRALVSPQAAAKPEPGVSA